MFRIVSLVLGGLLVLGGIGCHKHASSGQAKTLQEGIADLRTALASANPEVQSNLYHGVSYGLRYGDYAGASQALQSIASDPSLNDQQKKAVSEVSDLLKQQIESQQSAPAPAH